MQSLLNSFRIRYFARTVLGGLCLLFSGMAPAALMNADFSAGFDSWGGELVDSGGALLVDPDDVAYNPAFYSTILNGARIMTSGANTNVFTVALFQDFVVDSIAFGSTLELSLSLNVAADDAFAQLRDQNDVLPALDLLGGGTFDVTAWAGANAALEFGVSDVFFDFPDELEITDIMFTEIPGAAPVPPPLSLLAIGFVVLARKLQRT